jgi:hypothetical protein
MPTDTERLNWLEKDNSNLQDVYWHIENEEGTVREAIDWFMTERDNARRNE